MNFAERLKREKTSIQSDINFCLAYGDKDFMDDAIKEKGETESQKGNVLLKYTSGQELSVSEQKLLWDNFHFFRKIEPNKRDISNPKKFRETEDGMRLSLLSSLSLATQGDVLESISRDVGKRLDQIFDDKLISQF